ncbi:ABC transporter ATP-binding protein [Breznakiella homolactica]|uniref:ABC transporter ATP-binding protein n=1 Tax=Breznakiella homolactica TaxID=2798577 RepID=A0A7T8B8L6_9SPIR|nr:ABC transporter ATP-binding protein [Breznakiella homolactica]QQO07446.1 ABC transporter ATP-binding protein/permease [Breznakiella homolactica]
MRTPLRIFAGYYRPHWKLFAADMVCASLIAGVDLLFPMMTKFTIERLLPDQLYRFFFIMVALMVGVYLLRTAFSYFVTYWGHTVGAYIEADMRRDLFSHLQKLPYSFYDNHRTGHIMSRVTNDLFDVTELAHHGPEDIFISIATILGSFFLILTIRWEMAVILLLVVILIVVHAILSRKKLTWASRQVKEKIAEINASLESSISGARTAKAFTNESYENHKFHGGNEHITGAKKKYYKSMAGFHSKLEFMMNSLTIVTIAAGGFFIMQGTMTLTELITCNLFVAAFLQPIRRLGNFVEQYTTGMAGFTRFVDIMRIQPDIIDKPDASVLEKVRGNIEFRDVSFSYNRNLTVLEHIDLSIAAGSTVALVGPSGGGKTTLCHLLPRFYEIKEGSITIDGIDIRDVTLESLRKNIGIVQQDVFLFAGTIRENIGYGRIDAPEEEIIEAARRADIHDDIMKMPDRYDTVVGERGIKLSGGQKQRVSIARIFLKNPPILILDEATSALDTVTEMKIQSALEELSRGRTTMVIAHRLSTIRNADTIIAIDDNGIRQQGTHEELIKQEGIYARLYRFQFTPGNPIKS